LTGRYHALSCVHRMVGSTTLSDDYSGAGGPLEQYIPLVVDNIGAGSDGR
jgi:hypothetical protein